MEEIERLQDCLLPIRRILGWTAKEFGDRIDVTRQTINNLETKRTKLNKTQYIAIRAVLDAEMNEYPDETEMLKLLLDVFVDNPDKYAEKDKKELLSKINMLSPSVLAGTSTRADVSTALIAMTKAMGKFAVALAAISGMTTAINAWQKQISKKKE